MTGVWGWDGFDKVVSGSLDEFMPAEKSESRYQDTDNIILTFTAVMHKNNGKTKDYNSFDIHILIADNDKGLSEA